MIDTEGLKATYGDREYCWEGGFGAVISSLERGVKQGDVRAFGDELLYAWKVYPRLLRKSRVCWSRVGKHDAEWIREFKSRFFGVIRK